MKNAYFDITKSSDGYYSICENFLVRNTQIWKYTLSKPLVSSSVALFLQNKPQKHLFLLLFAILKLIN